MCPLFCSGDTILISTISKYITQTSIHFCYWGCSSRQPKLLILPQSTTTRKEQDVIMQEFFFSGSSCSSIFQRCKICWCPFSWTTSCIIAKLVTHHLSASRSFENNNPERPSLVGRTRHAEGGRRDPPLTPATALHLNHKLSRVGNCV